MANQVAKKEDAPLAVSNEELLEFAGQGVEGLGTEDLAIPFVNILQAPSPQLKKREGQYIEDAEEGLLFNTVTNELFSEVEVIPCAYKRLLIEWVPREQQGGFVFAHDPESGILKETTKNERGQDVLKNGNYLANTAQHYVLLLSPLYGPTQALVSMTSTQLKKSRRWNTQMVSQTIKLNEGGIKPMPSFSSAYNLSTCPETNQHGTWFGYEIGERRPATSEEFQMGAAFYQAVLAGTIKATVPDQEESSDEVPF